MNSGGKKSKSPLNQSGFKKAISFAMPLFLVAVIVIVVVTGYYFMVTLPGSLPTSTQTTFPTDVTDTTAVYGTAHGNPLNYTVVYIVNGASLGKEISFNPWSPTVVIGQNNTVIWKNLDIVNQSVVATNGGFSSPTIVPTQSWSYTFTTPGTYTYSNPNYPWENGTITVVS